MATSKQIEANRRNAQRSTGPRSELGKAVARFNALKHGMTADVTVLPYEDPESYAELRQSVITQFQPVGPAEAMLVEVIVSNYWRLLRARRVETSTLSLGIQSLKQRNQLNPAPNLADDNALAVLFTDREDSLRNLDRYHAQIERSYLRAVESLRRLQNERRREERKAAAEAKRQNGFVSQASSKSQQPEEPVSEQEVNGLPVTDYAHTRIIHLVRPVDREGVETAPVTRQTNKRAVAK